jgi:D-glycero-alpha-D-manno-heptose 1-phosphate guanylyltransferase
MMEAIILAGGRGTRLSNVVPDLPKPMAPVAGRPFLSYLLDMLITQGVTRICLSTCYKAEAIERYFGASFRGTKIVYAREESPLGTGGAISAALSATTARDVFVLNGDTIAQVDLSAMYMQHEGSGDQLTVALKQVSDSARYGAVSVRDGHIERFSEKGLSGSGYINVGVYLLRRDLFNAMPLPNAFSFEKQVLMDRLSDLRPGAFLSSGYFVDIGVPEDYARAQHELPSVIL